MTDVRNMYREIHIDMFEIQENSKEDTTGEFIALKFGVSVGRSDNSNTLTSRAIKTDHKRIPNMNPLY
jgi:hypothetical protein